MIKISIPKNHLLFLVIIFIFGVILRNLFLPQNLLFGYEQGRDFFVARDMASLKKFTLLGPKTDIAGIYHGVYYYYNLALIFFFTAGNPHAIAFFFTLVNAGVIFLSYLITAEFVAQKKFALLAALFTAASFNVLIYGRWLSNVSPSIFVFALFILFLTKLIKTPRSMLYLPVFFLWGLLLHFEILNFLSAGLLILVFFFLFKLRPRIKIIIPSLVLLFINLLPFIIFDIKHDYLQLNGILKYFSHPSAGFALTGNVQNFFIGLNREVATTLFPFAPVLTAGFYALIVLFVARWQKHRAGDRQSFIILLSFFFSFLPLVFFLKYAPLEQFYSGANVAIIVFFIFLLEKNGFIFLRSAVLSALITAIYLSINLYYTVSHLQSRENIFYHMPYKEITYGRQIKTIDAMFNTNESFEFDAFTTPLYHPEGWQYLYDWRGTLKYPKLYVENRGRQQKANLYLIIEPFTSQTWRKKWIEKYDQISTVSHVRKIDSILLQFRKFKHD